jgi:hypothetical protein
MKNPLRLKPISIAAVLLAVLQVYAAEPVQTLPLGTFLPVMLNSNLDSNKSKPGEKISAKIRQDVPLPDRGVIKSGTELMGHIVAVQRGGDGSSAKVVFVIDRIRMNRQQLPITTRLRALASMMAIAEARQPINSIAPDGSSTWDYNTRQVGGDVVFGRSDVRSGEGSVGMSPEPGWVIGIPRANPDAGCNAPDSNDIQAFWLFSTNACGVYGDDTLQISRQPSANKDGQVTLIDPKRVLVRGGAGLLLVTEAQPATQTVK